MHVVGVAAPPGVDTTHLVESLVARLAEDGRVGTVEERAHAPHVETAGKSRNHYRRAGAAVTAGLAGDGWVTTGASGPDGAPLCLRDALEDLAPTCDYAVVDGFAGADLPQVTLGDCAAGGTVLARADDPATVDVDEVVAALEDADPFVTLDALVARAKASADEAFAGAIATFTGRVRAREGPDDPATEYLEFEKYDGVAEAAIEGVCADIEEREGVYEVLAHHRTGVVERGEDIVFVVVLAGHRAEAFAAVEDGIDRIKAEVPLFKREVTVEEEFWAHDRPE